MRPSTTTLDEAAILSPSASQELNEVWNTKRIAEAW
jgi:hypothetical protein